MVTENVRPKRIESPTSLEAADSGAGVVIESAVAAAPNPTRKPRELGRLAGRLCVPEDFDDPLPEELLALFEGRGE